MSTIVSKDDFNQQRDDFDEDTRGTHINQKQTELQQLKSTEVSRCYQTATTDNIYTREIICGKCDLHRKAAAVQKKAGVPIHYDLIMYVNENLLSVCDFKILDVE